MPAGHEPSARPAEIAAPHPGSTTIVLLVSGEIDGDTVPRLCERFRLLLTDSDADQVICDVGALDDPGAATIDAVARLQLSAKRLGRRFRLRGASEELRALLALAGLGEVVSFCYGSPLEPKRQAEQREKALGIEEGVEPDDPTA